MKIGIVSPRYPSNDSSSCAFVHARAKLYKLNGHEVKIFIPSKKTNTLSFEGIELLYAPKKKLKGAVDDFSPDVVALHIPLFYIISFAKSLNHPKVVWLHGAETLWQLSLMPSKSIFQYIKKRILLVPRLVFQLSKIRSFLPKCEYAVFVSKWLKNEAQKHTMKEYSNAEIIHNPVDTNLFTYKKPEHIKKAVLLKNINTKKHGIDIGIRAFSNFKAAKLFIFGKGNYYNKYNKLRKKINSNSEINPKHIIHDEIPQLYRDYGFYLAPSRVETQGLSMCEAMACGLPVIATKVGGIPEFVRDNIDGYLVEAENPQKMQEAVIKLISDEEKFYKMSENARENIVNVCSESVIIEKELELLERAVEKYRNKKKCNYLYFKP